jgi:hypothetical protein
MTEISRWLSASDTTGSDARKETSSTPAGVAGEARGRTALRIGRRKRRIQRTLVSDSRPSGNPSRHSRWHHLRDAKRFDETVIRWCRRVAPQPPANLCHPCRDEEANRARAAISLCQCKSCRVGRQRPNAHFRRSTCYPLADPPRGEESADCPNNPSRHKLALSRRDDRD